MSETQRTQRTFFAVTMVTVIAMTTVFLAYAVLLATFYGKEVTVVTVQSKILYCATNSTTMSDWTETLDNVGNGSAWYTMLNITSAGYQGSVNITWTLQKFQSGSWSDVSPAVTVSINNFDLTGQDGQKIFASSNGLQATNHNWGEHTTSAGTYRVKVEIGQA